MKTLFDTHSHYNLNPLSEDWRTHWQKARESGVQHSIVVGTTLETSQLALEISQAEPKLQPSAAIHPYRFSEWWEDSLGDISVFEQKTRAQIDAITQLARSQPFVAVGETGLDYFRLSDAESERAQIIAAQKESLRAHINVAKEQNLPLILHVRDRGEQAYWDTLEILKSKNIGGLPIILHCVSGPMGYVQQALELGAYIGVAGNVTYPNAEHIRDVVRATPTDRILLETDAPYLPPQGHRGEPCEPWMVSLTGEYLQEELGIDTNTLTQNAKRIFPIVDL